MINAVECAVALQRGLYERNMVLPEAERVQVRIGINLGEVIVEGEDRYGEDVNVASRLEQLAEPGSIYVSGKVAREVEKKLAFGFEPLGERRMKNLDEPIRVYRVVIDGSATATLHTKSLALPTWPSVAVLPFADLSGDPEQEYFADGLVEELTTSLSKVRGLFVIARNSAFTYKGLSVDIRQVAPGPRGSLCP